MNELCREIQDLLAEQGRALLDEDDALRAHVEDCEDCSAVLAALEELDARLADLPALDASDGAVASVLDRVGEGEVSGADDGEDGPGRWWLLAGSLAAGVVMAALVTPEIMNAIQRGKQKRTLSDRRSIATAIESYSVDHNQYLDGHASPSAQGSLADHLGKTYLRRLPTQDAWKGQFAYTQEEPRGNERQPRTGESRRQAASSPPPGQELPGRWQGEVAEEDRDRIVGFRDTAKKHRTDSELHFPAPKLEERERDALESQPSVAEPGDRESRSSVMGGDTEVRPSSIDALDFTDTLAGGPAGPAEGLSKERELTGERHERESGALAGRGGSGREQSRGVSADESAPRERKTAAPSHRGPAAAFLAERDRTAGLELQPARGYWASTYLPGDPAFRLLEARLRSQAGTDASLVELARTARAYPQPFDLPRDGAVAVYLSADKAQAEGPTRMLIQVGLQATDRPAGRRPPMNVGLVLDLRGTPDAESAALLRAVVEAFAAAHEAGDRFSLTVAGRPGAVVIEPGAFRHGSVTLALRDLFADGSPAEARALDLPEALRVAVRATSADDDPSAPLGASEVVVITPDALGADLESLKTTAHTAAVGGVPVSAFGVGPRAALEDLEGLALAGQGHRRLVTSADEAQRAVERELHAASRAVARAVRLRIRLAPGVELVDIVGSRRLDQLETHRVKRVERSVDLRLARNLGITADRGRDEAGIQMVIPWLEAGDHHVVLLDVLAPGPGELADVRVRYKDLVHMRNGVSEAALAVGSRTAEPGPLERNVLANLVSREVAESIRLAAGHLGTGRRDLADRVLARTEALLAGLRTEVDGWDRHDGIAGDLALVRRYRQLLGGSVAQDAQRRTRLADSMRLASWRKVTGTTESP